MGASGGLASTVAKPGTLMAITVSVTVMSRFA
jgi:hypothetical protein